MTLELFDKDVLTWPEFRNLELHHLLVTRFFTAHNDTSSQVKNRDVAKTDCMALAQAEKLLTWEILLFCIETQVPLAFEGPTSHSKRMVGDAVEISLVRQVLYLPSHLAHSMPDLTNLP